MKWLSVLFPMALLAQGTINLNSMGTSKSFSEWPSGSCIGVDLDRNVIFPAICGTNTPFPEATESGVRSGDITASAGVTTSPAPAIVPDARGTASSRMVTITFSPQGAEAMRSLANRVIPGVGFAHVEICAPRDLAIAFASGRAYQAASRIGLSPLGPHESLAVGVRQQKVNRTKVVLDVFTLSDSALASLSAAGDEAPIKLKGSERAWITFLIPMGILGSRLLQERLPDQGWLSRILQGDLSIAAGRCFSDGIMLLRYKPGMTDQTVEVEP